MDNYGEISSFKTHPVCRRGGIVHFCSWSKYAAVIFGKTKAQENPPRSPFVKWGFWKGIVLTFAWGSLLLDRHSCGDGDSWNIRARTPDQSGSVESLRGLRRHCRFPSRISGNHTRRRRWPISRICSWIRRRIGSPVLHPDRRFDHHQNLHTGPQTPAARTQRK